MTLTSTASATTVGNTVITVSPAKAVPTNKYKYKLYETEPTLPELNDDLSAWTTWNGTDEIAATSGYYIVVAECDKNNRCDKVGSKEVVSKEQEEG